MRGVLVEARSVDGIWNHIHVGRLLRETLALKKVDAVGEGHTDKGVEVAGVAAEHLIQCHSAERVDVHQTVVCVDSAELHDLTLTNRGVEHDTRALMKMHDIDPFLKENLRVARISKPKPVAALASKQRSTEKQFPSSCSLTADSRQAECHPKAHIRGGCRRSGLSQ